MSPWAVAVALLAASCLPVLPEARRLQAEGVTVANVGEFSDAVRAQEANIHFSQSFTLDTGHFPGAMRPASPVLWAAQRTGHHVSVAWKPFAGCGSLAYV